MKALRIHAFGEAPRLDEVDEPHPQTGESLVEMRAATVGHIDRSVAGGTFLQHPPLPYIPGIEGAGIVLSSSSFAVGERVWLRGQGLGMRRDGTWCERIAAPDAALGRLPDAVPMPLGSAFFSPCTSAWVALHEVARVQPGERVLVTGANGAVGAIAVQLALEAGAQVHALVRSSEQAALLPAGASPLLLDRVGNAAPLAAHVLIDAVGGAVLRTVLPHLAPGARCVLVGYTAGTSVTLELPELMQRDVSLLPLNMMRREGAGRTTVPGLLERLADGRLSLPVRRFAMRDAAEAMAWITERGHRGRAVLDPMV